jgi:orotate phosphoribosyltransferase
MSVNLTQGPALSELVERHRKLYVSPEIDTRLERIIRKGTYSNLSEWDVHRILRTAQAVFFDTHVEVVSGHHTGTYLRFESIARVPELLGLIVRDMANWLSRTFEREPIAGIVTTGSAAVQLADGVAKLLPPQTGLRVTVTPYNCETGRIGTEISEGRIRPGERFVALNDVTTRGNCVSKLGKVITDQGGRLAGMMVFARRDSGQFPLMDELIATYPFYYTTDLDMPQWEPERCPLCRDRQPLLFWRDMPEL